MTLWWMEVMQEPTNMHVPFSWLIWLQTHHHSPRRLASDLTASWLHWIASIKAVLFSHWNRFHYGLVFPAVYASAEAAIPGLPEYLSHSHSIYLKASVKGRGWLPQIKKKKCANCRIFYHHQFQIYQGSFLATWDQHKCYVSGKTYLKESYPTAPQSNSLWKIRWKKNKTLPNLL